jgi:chromatin assembly factor 1 subunit B
MYCCGSHQRHTTQHRRWGKKSRTIRKHGESSPCVGLLDRRYTTWLGLQKQSTSSLGVLTILQESTMLRMVRSFCFCPKMLTMSGQHVRQIAEHNHYVQGVAWDPLNEFVATQSSDRAVHIYTLKTKDGQFSLADRPHKHTKLELAPRRVSSNSPAPPEIGPRASFVSDASSLVIASPAPSMPGTPTSLSLPMNPPAIAAHSRRSSFSSSPSIRRSASPAPSLPLPAVRPMEASPRPLHGLGVRTLSYANEMMTTYFRRLTFTPDGALLLTPAGQYKTTHPSTGDGVKSSGDVINTVYIYSRAGLNKPPVAHLPGHRKASIAVRCSPIFYTLRKSSQPTKNFTIDTSSSEESMPALPEPAVSSTQPAASSVMDPPPLVHASPGPTSDPYAPLQSPKPDLDNPSSATGPQPAFALPYRMVYAVATQDSVLIYDTQQLTPLCIVSNLHPTSFTDLTW